MIPRMVHRIWVGSVEPDWMQACGQTWEQPGWHVATYNQPPFTLHNQEWYDQAADYAPHHTGQLQADLMRLELLWYFGGVYVDTDYQLLTTIDDLCDAGPWLAWEVQDVWLNQAIVAAPPHDPWIELLIDEAPKSIRKRQGHKPNVMTGPQFVTRMWPQAHDGWSAYPEAWFYPLSWRDAANGVTEIGDAPDARALHFFANKRREKGQPMPTIRATT